MNNYRKELEDYRDTVFTKYFDNEIKPILDRYDWILFSSMGAIGIVDQEGNCKINTKTAESLINKANKTFRGFYDDYYTVLWDIMCSADRCNFKYGVYELSAYNPCA